MQSIFFLKNNYCYYTLFCQDFVYERTMKRWTRITNLSVVRQVKRRNFLQSGDLVYRLIEYKRNVGLR